MSQCTVVILRNVLEFLDIAEALTLLNLNKALRDALFTPGVCQTLALKIMQHFEEDEVTPENCLEFLHKYVPVEVHSPEELLHCVKTSLNLTKNPFGGQGLNHWRTSRNDWTIENWQTWNGRPTVFVGTYFWLDLEQVVEIPASTQERVLVVGTPIARRYDCKSEAKVQVKLYNEAREEVDTAFAGQRCNDDLKYHLLKCSVPLRPGQRYRALLTYSSKDTRFWAGNYGARLGFPFARVFNKPESK